LAGFAATTPAVQGLRPPGQQSGPHWTQLAL